MRSTLPRYALAAALILLVFLIVLYAMGRIPLGAGGFGFWSGAWDQSSSQNVADPYSTSHILHGIIFFWALWAFRRKLPPGSRFLIALLIEVGWEILENSPLIIDRYRANTASLDYYGDSILNSFFDVVFMSLGFWFASKVTWKWSLALFLLIELTLLVLIRDNLTLNVLMLLIPLDTLREWQMGGR